MPKEISSVVFVKKITECVKEYKKQMSNCRDDSDASYFFDKKLKKFLVDHKDEVIILSSLNFERPFISWIKNYLLAEKK